MTGFDFAPVLEDEALRLRPVHAKDHDALFRAARDPAIWAGHPAKTRHLEPEFQLYFDFLAQAGGTLVAEDVAAAAVIGCSRFYVSPDAPQAVSIGFTFLATAYWGGAWNRRVKRLMLGHAFETFDEVWFHVAPDNIRSQKATSKLGAVFIDETEVDLNGAPAPWRRYRLSSTEWAAAERAHL